MNTSSTTSNNFSVDIRNSTYVNDSQTLSSTSSILWLSAIVAITVFGIASNASLLVVIARSKKLRSGTGFLILHLIAVGLLMCCVQYPILIVVVYLKTFSFILPDNICDVINCLMLITTYASNWTEGWLGVNRFIATVFPHKYKAWTRKNVCLGMMASCWVISTCTVTPISFGVGGYYILTPQGQCNVRMNSIGRWLLNFDAFAPYIVVASSTIAVLGQIVKRHVAAHGPKVHDDAKIVSERVIQKRLLFRKQLNIAGTFFLTFLFCVLCNTPLSIVVTFFGQVYSHTPLLRLWMRVCTACQYAFTPLIFFVCNQDYRTGFVKLVCWTRTTACLRSNTLDLHDNATRPETNRLQSYSEHNNRKVTPPLSVFNGYL